MRSSTSPFRRPIRRRFPAGGCSSLPVRKARLQCLHSTPPAGNLSNPSDNAIVAFDTLAQSVRWTSKGAYSGNPAYVDGLLFAANSASGMLEARKESDGSVNWSWTAPSGDQYFVSDVLVTKNLVFVSTDNTTYAIDRASHAAVWGYKASGKLALSANGILYIKGESTIVAINLK